MRAREVQAGVRSAGALRSASTGGCEASASAGARAFAARSANPVRGVRGSAICEHGRQRSQCKECGARPSAAREAAEVSARSAGLEHLRAREGGKCKSAGLSDLRAREGANSARVRGGTSASMGGSKASARSAGLEHLQHGRVRSQCKECGGCRSATREGAKILQGLSRGSGGVRSGDPPPLPTCAPREGGARDQTRAQRHVRSGRRPRHGGGVQRQARAHGYAGPGDLRAVTPPDITSRLRSRISITHVETSRKLYYERTPNASRARVVRT